MKKVIIFLAIIVVLFAGIAFITKYQQSKNTTHNPYAKAKSVNELKPETKDQLDDPLYQNIILPNELKSKLQDKKDVTVYFFSPTCPHCKRTSPIVVPLAKKMGIDLKEFNLYEFDDGWDQYKIEATPTIIHYKNGVEDARIVGEHTKAEFKQWFNKHVK
ncbi:thioredoxin family protein [Heyndrickxia ginsengihumi]|uniref:Thioredoxin n=1 Tax=Heyndrickxia ginsengihumi TaxID=363870 RepID=A0A0A6V967_9BACI|nr:thioredoxin family protein [Heyndrickxia ginsengihumi]KHD84118.1 thioredoxin [Heyndrickxia ginsengihumi]MBE6184739.1 thioredoxin [Bacillus sp. (in: firmicutes)]MCM3022975.1 thioredoxin family protein [Heyndrickxia ginsengihumi]NEY19446.1 thioredoxin family protein [Heyndrickxia ginsengihumi]